MSPSATKTASSPRFASADWKWRTSIRARELGVADHDSGDEDGEEPRAVRDGREAVDDAGAEHHRQRVQRAVGQRHAAQRLQHHDAGDGADREPDAHLPQELPGDVGDPGRGHGRQLDHPDHQRDPDRVVEPRLALEDRPGAALDLLAGEHRERHRRIGRCERSADQERDGPVEAEQVVRRDRDERCGGEGSDDAEDRDRHGGGAEPAQADARAAVEEDRDQGERGDPLDVLEREQARQPVGELGGDRRDGQQQRGRGEADPGGEDSNEDRDRQGPGDDQDDPPEIEDVVHVADSPCCGARRLR